jgi:LysR family hydrogen peroxide-inducible transcriptional activator
VTFRDPQPSRRIAMVWRRSSAMAEFLSRLAVVFRELPPGLLDTRNLQTTAPTPFLQARR